ncbi:MAG TPA: pitrilysin family protein [Planctomycetaceae bacterium]|nr:pitrilysin family protein [Planctomycetaceae bacterium]
MHFLRTVFYSALIVTCVVAVGRLAQGADASAKSPAVDIPGAKYVTTIEGISEYRLENGLQVLLLPDASKPSVTVNMTVLVGSRHEGYGEAGMAHLLEHMLFKGTPNFSGPKEIPNALHKRGAEYNATTDVDRTNFHETLPANDSNLEFAIRLEADRLINSYVHAADLKSEMTVVRNEFEAGENNPLAILLQRIISAAYDWHNYGKSTIGNKSDIERVPITKLQEFYHRHYQPENTVLTIAGKFQPKTALENIVKYFGAIPRSEFKQDTTYTEEPPQDGQRIVRLKRVGNVAVVGAAYHIPAAAQAEFNACEVLEGILSDDPSGRLYKGLVETRQAARVFGITFAYHDPGVMVFLAMVVPGKNPEDVLKAMEATIADVAKKGVTQAEVDRIRQQILKQREHTAADSARLGIEMSEWASLGDWRLYFLHRDRLEKVTAADVNKAAAKYLKPDNSTLGLFLPTKSPDRSHVPPVGDLAATIGDYKGRSTISGGETFDPSPANIDARTQNETLTGGVKAALLAKKTRGNDAHLRLELHYGDLSSLRGLRTACGVLPELMVTGTKNHNKQQIQDTLDKLKATLRASGSAGDATFSIQARRETLPDVLKLLKEILREPTLPESELDLIRQAELAQLKNQLSEPSALAGNAIRRHMAPYEKDDPRYVPTLPESIDALQALTVADVRRLYSNYLAGSHGELAIVGDFDKAQVLPLLNEMLGDWKAEMPYAHISRDVTAEIPGGSLKIETPDKANAIYLSAYVFPMRDDNPDFAALSMGDFILGEDTLTSRLGTRVRQKEGMTYGIVSRLQASARDQRTSFVVQAICNPIYINKVTAAVAEEIDALFSKGVQPDELATAKQSYLQQQELARASDRELVGMLVENLTVGRTMKYYADLEKHIAGLTSDQIVAALRSHIDLKRLFIVTAGDFAKSQASSR